MAPLLDCKTQLPLWAFATIITTTFVFLGVCWKIADIREKKMKKARRERREADHLVNEAGNSEMGIGGTSTRNSKMSNSNLSRRKVTTSMDFSADKKLGSMSGDNRPSAHFATDGGGDKNERLLIKSANN